MKNKNLKISRTKSFLDQIKNIFHGFWRPIIWWKIKKLADTSFMFVKKTSMPNPAKALDISSAPARVAPDLLKVLAILPHTTERRSPIDWEDLQPYWKSEKRPQFSRWSRIILFTNFSLFTRLYKPQKED